MAVEDSCKRLFSGLICEILYAVGQGKFYIYHRKVSKFKKKPMALATMFKVLFLIKSKLTLLFPYIKNCLILHIVLTH